MGIKIYDFDHTIYDGNSTLDFYFYCLKKHPSVVVRIPWQVSAALLYLMRIYNKTQFKQSFFSFLTLLHQIDELIFGFWTIYRKNLKQWYLCKEHSEDVV
ncbi:MAG: polysaccharide biosynthesis protein GtrA, partial [Bacillota bacterium]